MENTREKSKSIRINIKELMRRIDNGTILFNHPSQREAEMWSKLMMANLISDILQENPVPPLVFAEQVVNEIPIIWNLDGKQRSTNVYDYVKNEYAISKNVTRYLITYYVAAKDENGRRVVDDKGFPVFEKKEFDIRKKKFDQLPKELQERILNYSFDAVQYLNCSDEDISYHIARYNEGKQMNISQKGTTRLGTQYARLVKNMTEMSFFEDGIGKYNAKQFKNGTIDRIIVESVMVSNYMDKWDKNYNNICEFLKLNADVSAFNKFESLVQRLEDVVTPEVGEMFDSKNSHLWFGLFAKFDKLNMSDDMFVDFMNAFKNELHNVKFEGKTYDELCINPESGKERSNKDKNVIIEKIYHLTCLMCDYLGVDRNEINKCASEEEECSDKLPSGQLVYLTGYNTSNYIDFSKNFDSEETAIQSLMLISNSPYSNDFKAETIKDFIKWQNDFGENEIFEECLLYKEYANDCGISNSDKNLPFYIYAARYLDLNTDICIDEWLSEFKSNAFVEIDSNPDIDFNSMNSILLKKSEIINKIKEYEGEDGNDEITNY